MYCTASFFPAVGPRARCYRARGFSFPPWPPGKRINLRAAAFSRCYCYILVFKCVSLLVRYRRMLRHSYTAFIFLKRARHWLVCQRKQIPVPGQASNGAAGSGVWSKIPFSHALRWPGRVALRQLSRRAGANSTPHVLKRRCHDPTSTPKPLAAFCRRAKVRDCRIKRGHVIQRFKRQRLKLLHFFRGGIYFACVNFDGYKNLCWVFLRRRTGQAGRPPPRYRLASSKFARSAKSSSAEAISRPLISI